jgi:hypothetical protein
MMRVQALDERERRVREDERERKVREDERERKVREENDILKLLKERDRYRFERERIPEKVGVKQKEDEMMPARDKESTPDFIVKIVKKPLSLPVTDSVGTNERTMGEIPVPTAPLPKPIPIQKSNRIFVESSTPIVSMSTANDDTVNQDSELISSTSSNETSTSLG